MANVSITKSGADYVLLVDQQSVARVAAAANPDLTAVDEFRIINGSHNQLIDLEARIVFTRFEEDGGRPPLRKYYQLSLERERVSFFPASWTVVHPIDSASPLFGVTAEQLRRSNAEFLILLSGYDEASGETVHLRSSYTADEVVYGVRFRGILDLSAPDGVARLDIRGISDTEPAAS